MILHGLELPARQADSRRDRGLRPAPEADSCRLVMIGDGPDRPAAEALCRERGISSIVHFLGNTPAVEEIIPRREPLRSHLRLRVVRPLGPRGPGLRRTGPRLSRGGLPEVVVNGETGFLRRWATWTASRGRGVGPPGPVEGESVRGGRPKRAVTLFNAETAVRKYLAVYERVLAA